MSKRLEQKILIGFLVMIVMITIIQTIIQFLEYARVQAYLEKIEFENSKTKYTLEYPLSRII